MTRVTPDPALPPEDAAELLNDLGHYINRVESGEALYSEWTAIRDRLRAALAVPPPEDRLRLVIDALHHEARLHGHDCRLHRDRAVTLLDALAGPPAVDPMCADCNHLNAVHGGRGRRCWREDCKCKGWEARVGAAPPEPPRPTCAVCGQPVICYADETDEAPTWEHVAFLQSNPARHREFDHAAVAPPRRAAE